MAARLLLLVCAGALLRSAEARDPYDQLSDSYKKGVDLALEQLNTHVGVKHHFRFLRTVEKREHDVSLSFTQNIHKGFIYTEMMTTREDHWKKMTYATGGATIMALSTG
ncbi:hypothetical protein XENOCAPTIV_016932 [Xenoophorus captivus]|uniref:Uncharacterized protein n=1 Tax=Xenoophorus captivus TaxID=1517983 RepID=A0ABV0RCL8_9TELE